MTSSAPSPLLDPLPLPAEHPANEVAATPPHTPRAYTCECGQPVFFRNSRCLQCDRPLGYDSQNGRMLTLQPGPQQGTWQATTANSQSGALFRRCANLDSPAACNWLIELDPAALPDANTAQLCAACQLNRTVPDLSVEENGALWARIEQAKRRLVSALITLGLPVASRLGADPERGLAFDFLRAAPGEGPVITGHADGIITINIEEADDAHREKTRNALHEPYRTALGHLRHEVGHYYWDRLVDGSAWLNSYRELFGDERADYTQALQTHYENGPPADWAENFVSAYASSHPWEDWAESWAHYLHMLDAVATARSFNVDTDSLALQIDEFRPVILGLADDPPSTDPSATRELQSGQAFLALLNTWVRLNAVLNEMSRSMGLADFYPFVLSVPAVRKLYFVHRVVADAAHAARAVPDSPAA